MVSSRGSYQFNVRLPDGLKDRVQAWARKNNRSLNSEIVVALEEKFPKPPEPETLNERLAEASLRVAAAWSSALTALGQDPKGNRQLSELIDALEEAGKI